MMACIRTRWILPLFALGGCVTPKDVGQTPDTDVEQPDSTSGEPGSEVTGNPGGLQLCPDNPGMCADVDGNFCGDDAGGPISTFDADCCARPRCDGDGQCPDGRVCVVLGGWGGGASSSMSCVPEGGACSCGATADGDPDAAVCVPAELAPPAPAPEQCSTGSTGTALTVSPDEPTMVGTASCTVTALVGTAIDLQCEGDFAGPVTLGVATGAPSFAIRVDDVVGVTLSNKADGGPTQWYVVVEDSFGERVIVAGNGEDLTPDGSTPPWPTNVSTVELIAIGCPVSECGDFGLVLRASQDGDQAIDVAPGQSKTVVGKFGGYPPILSVFEARLGAGECDRPTARWVGYSMVIPGIF
jgi:hypothetical protein